ncbi:hypothetical protein Pyn_12592 [Prunus yedoensis var. nudiflora]|uniref:Uncharacterized protein n=1 Tax=Prunus yedoensis var. nudiflora TaxID=2094558 RepID=A0A314Y931_PRUYE|nr:hypothetical protein Pyn_12592 [Prunus yedoensis var. nudiflora]
MLEGLDHKTKAIGTESNFISQSDNCKRSMVLQKQKSNQEKLTNPSRLQSSLHLFAIDLDQDLYIGKSAITTLSPKS